MSEYYYSPSENAFYPESLRDLYEDAGTWPTDGVVISEAQYTEFSGTPPDGKVRTTGDDGYPAWGDIPPPTQDDLIAESEAKKIQLRQVADAEIAWRQDAFDAGISTEEEAAALVEWKKYRVLLMRVDTALATDWPEPPND